MERPLVSVIMAAYNSASTIGEAVDSVLSQSLKRIELIVYDDASLDSTQDILGAICDNRLTVLKGEKNIGPGMARDEAIVKSAAPWIAFIDADDLWQSDRLEKLLSIAEYNENKIIFDDIMICHDVNGAMKPWQTLRGKNAFGCNGKYVKLGLEAYILADRLLIKPLVPAKLIREKALRHSDKRFGEDTEFFIRLGHLGTGFIYYPEALYWYRVKPGSLTSQSQDFNAMRVCLENLSQLNEWSDTETEAFQRKISALRANETLYEVRDMIQNGHFFKALVHLFSKPHALKIFPGRAFRHVRYQIHRIIHGGENR